MKVDFNNWKAFLTQFVSYWFQKVIVNYNLTRRFVVLLLMTALLMPIVYFADWQKASAQSLQSSLSFPQMPASVSAPPEQFHFSGSSSIQTATVSAFSSLGTIAANASAPVVNFFTAPKMPQGFEMAKTVSPASAMLSSLGVQITSFFGFFAPSSAAAKKIENAENAEMETENKEAESKEASGKAGDKETENTESETASASMVLTQPAANVDFDFDGDNKADIARYHRATSEWKVVKSSNGSIDTVMLGSYSSTIIPGDFIGDSKTDFAVFTKSSTTSDAVWTIVPGGGGTTQTFTFGLATDKPVVGDYDGNGKADLAVYRPSTNTWWIQNSNGTNGTTFGAASDITVPADYDGDGKTDIAVFRPSTGDWHILKSGSGYWTMNWGLSSDVPVPADYDGDGKTDVAIYRGSTGMWFIHKSSDGVTMYPVWGNYGDQPVPADYDGDGKADVGVWRPATGVWHIYKSATDSYYPYTLGLADDLPVPAAYYETNRQGDSQRRFRQNKAFAEELDRRHRSLFEKLQLGNISSQSAGQSRTRRRIGNQLQLAGLDETQRHDVFRCRCQ